MIRRWLGNWPGGKLPTKNELGRIGEDAVAKELRRRGYLIRERNFRCSLGEIDIVAEGDGEIVIVEVKTRSGGSYGDLQDAVKTAKARWLVSLGEAYLAQKELHDVDRRIDVVDVRTDLPAGTKVGIIRNAVGG